MFNQRVRSRLLVILVAANLRAGLGSIPPVLIIVGRDLELSIFELSLLTAIPLFSYATVPLLYHRVAVRVSIQAIIRFSFLFFALFSMLRLVGNAETLFFGTLAMAACISLLNVGLPIWISELEKTAEAGLVGYFSAAMGFTASIAIAAAAPLTLLIPGLSWRSALIPWAVLSVVTNLIIWKVSSLKGNLHEVASEQTSNWNSFLELLANQKYRGVIVFFATQSVSTFTIGAWLPTILYDKGFTLVNSGYLFAISSASGALLGLVFSRQILYSSRPEMIAIAASSLTLVGLIGITSDSAVVLTVMVLVVAIGKFATYALAIHFMVSNSLSIAGKQQLSTASQVIGYSLAFGGPVVVGLIYENSNSWNPGLLMLAGITLVQTYFGFVACKRD